MILYRPVGPKELELITQAGSRAFPPCEPEQPVFYAVVHLDDAGQIAHEAIKGSSSEPCCLTKFEVEPACAQKFEVHTAANPAHQELKVPADELDEFNRPRFLFAQGRAAVPWPGRSRRPR